MVVSGASQREFCGFSTLFGGESLRILRVFAAQLREPLRILRFFIVFRWPVAANATYFDAFLPRESLRTLRILLVFWSPAERAGALSSVSQVCG
jgi:hypothetical protein